MSHQQLKLEKHRYSLCCHHMLRLVGDSIRGQDRPTLLVIVTVEIVQILLSRKVSNKKKKKKDIAQ